MRKKLDIRFSLFRRYLRVCATLICLGIFPVNFSYADDLLLAAADSAPTAFMKDGQPAGLLVDVVTEAFRRAGYPIKIKLMPWARCLAEAREGTVDGIFSSFKLPEREAFLSFTDVPIIVQTESFFVRSESSTTFNGDLKELKDIKIGVILDTSYGARVDAMIKDGIWRDVAKANNVDSLVAMLLAGRFDLIPSYRHVVLNAAKKAGALDKIRELSPSIDAVPSYLAFSKKRDYAGVMAAFNKAMNDMKREKVLESIEDRYLK